MARYQHDYLVQPAWLKCSASCLAEEKRLYMVMARHQQIYLRILVHLIVVVCVFLDTFYAGRWRSNVSFEHLGLALRGPYDIDKSQRCNRWRT